MGERCNSADLCSVLDVVYFSIKTALSGSSYSDVLVVVLSDLCGSVVEVVNVCPLGLVYFAVVLAGGEVAKCDCIRRAHFAEAQLARGDWQIGRGRIR